MLKPSAKLIPVMLILALLAFKPVPVALAGAASAPLSASCASDYVVQPGDQLNKIAQQFLGTLRSAPNIVTATNEAAAANNAYHQVTNPSLLGVGWRLCIPPATSTVQAPAAQPQAPAAQPSPNAGSAPLSASCASDYVVQPGDQLNKIALQFLGMLRSAPNIVTATNAAAATNSAYHQVTDPSVLGVGWRLCIPPATQ